jgi:ATP-dependent Clp protease adaptor protein ClpS
LRDFGLENPGKDSPDAGGEVAVETRPKTAMPFKVVLFNDEEHTYDYVVEMLTGVCRLSRDNAFRCAVEVDLTGRTIVFYGPQNDCADACSKIMSYGPDHRLPQSMGSMNAEVQSH